MSTFGSNMTIKSEVENHFTAKTPRAQRTESREKNNYFTESVKHNHSYSNSSFSLASSRLCGGSFIPAVFFRMLVAGSSLCKQQREAIS